MPKKTTLFVLSVVFVFSLSGCSSISGLFATPTPTATNTPTVTPTPLPTNTPTPTPLPTFTPTPEPVTFLEELPDGSVLFIDKEIGYQFVVPTDWLVLDLTDEDISEIVDVTGEAIPEIKELLEELTPTIQQGIRVYIFDTNEEHFQGSSPNIGILFDDSQNPNQFSMDQFVELIVEALPELFPSIEILDWGFGFNSNGVEYGEIVSTIPQIEGVTEQAAKQSQVFIKINDGLMIITFSSPENVYSEVEEIFEEMFDSFELIED